MGAPNGNQLEKFLWQNMETLFALLLRFFFLFTFTFRFYSKQSKRFVLLFRSVAHLPFSDPVRCGAVRTRHCFVLCSAMLSCVEWNDIAARNCSSCHRFKPFKLIFQEHFSCHFAYLNIGSVRFRRCRFFGSFTRVKA